MNLFDKVKEIMNAMENTAGSDNTDITIEKSFGSSVKITIKVASVTETLDLEGLSLDELEELLEELEQKLAIIQADEPEDEDSEDYEEWEAAIEEIEEQIDDVQSAIDDWDE